MVRFAPFLLVLVLEVFCVIDVIVSPAERVRHLPKIGWLLLVLVFPLVGSIAWLFAGRPPGTRAAGRSPYERAAPTFPEYDRPGRAAGTTAEADEEFLRRIRDRAEEQRRKAAEQKRREQEQDGPDGTEP